MAISHGFGGLKTVDVEHEERTSETNGITAMRRPRRYAVHSTSFRSRCFCKSGLFLAIVSDPMSKPRFLRREESEAPLAMVSEVNRTLIESYVILATAVKSACNSACKHRHNGKNSEQSFSTY